jgi:cytoskeletal protein CcmA (bactofilin family)
MKTVLKIVSVLVLAMLLFVPQQSAGASNGAFDGQVVFGQSFTLKSGNSMNGDLLVFGGSVTIEEGATINGSVVLFGGNLVVNGTVTGDVAITGGSASLGSAAHISGNLITVAASLNRAEGSLVDGQIYNTATSWIGDGKNSSNPQPVIPAIPAIPAIPPIKFEFQPLVSVLNGFGQSLGIAILAMLLMLFLAPHADRVAHAIIAQPLTAGGLGLLTTVVAPIAIVLSVVTLIGIPLALIIVVALVVAGVFGWIAIGYEIGQRFTKAIHQNWHPAFSAGLGTFALTLVAKILTGIPVLNCVGWLVPFLLSMAALGAVLMTRFGTQVVAASITQAVVVPTKPVE